MSSFTPNHALLNPKFEGYKLAVISQEDAVTRFGLEYRPTQVANSGRSPLSFKEVQSRITHNHLAMANDSGRCLYIDSEHHVILVDFMNDSHMPSFTVVYELPAPISAPAAVQVHREYPSAVFLDARTAFVADGQGALYILALPVEGAATNLGCFELSNVTQTLHSAPAPFRIHSVAKTSDGAAIALLSSRFYGGPEASPMQSTTSHTSEFDVWAARFLLPLPTQKGDLAPLDILWRRRGQDVPIFMEYDNSRKCYLLAGSSVYRELNQPAPLSYEPSPDEMAPIPRLDEKLDVETPPRPPPYSWTQTSDSVTVAFPLPATTPTSSIKVTFSQKTLTVHVQSTSHVEGVPLPRYSAKQLWDGIQTSTSFWTWDREGEHSFGLLTLHLDKQREDSRWMHIFASAGTPGGEEEVPETLDPSELYLIRESLEKYTAALQSGEDMSGLGLGRGVPTLAQGEVDEEVDSSVGRVAFLTWVGEDGGIPVWSSGFGDSVCNVLSIDLPGSGPGASMVVKNGIDGTLFTLDEAQTVGSLPTWTHSATFSALAFVLASKRDTRFTYHVSSKAVLAFENGSRDRGGNVYIYRGGLPGQIWAKQSVLKVGDGGAGSLLGVGTFKTVQGHTIVCLCENELVVMDNIF
ncbi:hypothetical protein DEU56DRAFT_982371 [Suillus clintonianus]|uniref:uncharacterized protein n=1 Tax=Suillus clintonianus TaxID=1904413 RepID=UPI001B878CE3|nr:uncharacterized protein DEU56DRAFT_982371 [Suillus clintonianus]KAG2129105.1 hypothetical protein DEU56DRAFT_982371 [Suillus clintonianus]